MVHANPEQLQAFPYYLSSSDDDQNERLDPQFWTILVLAPVSHYCREKTDINKHLIRSDVKDLYQTMLSAIRSSLSQALESWRKIGTLVEDLLEDDDLFMDHEKHDNFFFNDQDDLAESKKVLLGHQLQQEI